MNNFLKFGFCLILFVLKAHTLSAQVDALIVTPEGNVNVPNGKVQEKGNDLLPRGAIILWYGTEADVPKGWAICNGKDSTPNLSGRFVVGAGSTQTDGTQSYQPGNKGGSDMHTLTEGQMPSHTHNAGNLKTTADGGHNHQYKIVLDVSNTWDTKNSGYVMPEGNKTHQSNKESALNETTSPQTEQNGSHNHAVIGATQTAGSGEAFDNRPKYYALCYIMKL